jgi:hypothetical protein
MKGTSKEVPHFGKCDTWSAHHLSGSRQATCKCCWGPIGRVGLFWEGSILQA